MCIHMCRYVFMYVCECGGQRSTLDAIPQEPHTLFCEIRALHWLGACWLSEAGWPASSRSTHLYFSALRLQTHHHVRCLQEFRGWNSGLQGSIANTLCSHLYVVFLLVCIIENNGFIMMLACMYVVIFIFTLSCPSFSSCGSLPLSKVLLLTCLIFFPRLINKRLHCICLSESGLFCLT